MGKTCQGDRTAQMECVEDFALGTRANPVWAVTDAADRSEQGSRRARPSRCRSAARGGSVRSRRASGASRRIRDARTSVSLQLANPPPIRVSGSSRHTSRSRSGPRVGIRDRGATAWGERTTKLCPRLSLVTTVDPLSTRSGRSSRLSAPGGSRGVLSSVAIPYNGGPPCRSSWMRFAPRSRGPRA